MVDVQPYLRKLVERASAPGIQAGLRGFSKTVLFIFTDSQENWLIRFADGRPADPVQETPAKADITITTSTDVLAGVMDRKLDPIAATMQRGIRIRGPVGDLLRLQALMT